MTSRKHLRARRVLYLMGLVELILMVSVGSLGVWDQYRIHGWTWTQTVIIDGVESTETVYLATNILALSLFTQMLLLILVAYSDLPKPNIRLENDGQQKALEP